MIQELGLLYTLCYRLLLMSRRNMMIKRFRRRKLCKKVSRLLALALNLEETYFDKAGITDDPVATLRLLHYSG